MDWFSCVDDGPDENTSMWVVEPDIHEDGTKFTSIIHLNTIVRAAHLLPVFGQDLIS